MKDIDGDEIDGWDETLVSYDSRTEGVFDISDDEINGLLKQLTQKTKNVTFIFDSCHSGAAARGGNRVRMIEPDQRQPPPAVDFAISSRGGDGETDLRFNGSDYVLISGCLANELSNEGTFNERQHGAMSWFLIQALKGSREGTTYQDILDDVKFEVASRYPSQHPQLEGPGANLTVFGVDKINPRPYVLVKPQDAQNIVVEGGKVYGLRPGTILKVYPPKTKDFEKKPPVATVKISSANDFMAVGEIVSGGPVQPQSRAVLEAVFFGETAIPVHVDVKQSASLQQIKDVLASMEALTLVKDETKARLVVKQQDGKITVQAGDLEVLAPPVPLAEQDHVARIVEQVKKIVHWMTVLGLKNAESGIRIGLEVRLKDAPSGTPFPDVVPLGTKLVYEVKNLDEQPLYVYVLDVSSSGKVTVLYPKGEQQELRPGGKIERQPTANLPPGYSVILDVLKVIATTRQIDPSVFSQEAIRAASPATSKAAQDPLSQFLARAMRGTKELNETEVKTWVTVQKSIRIRQTGAKLGSFSVHFDGRKELQDIQTKLAASRDICPGDSLENIKGCDRLVSDSRDGSVFEFIPRGLSRGEERVVPVGQAFDEAYVIQDQTGARRVEPLLEIQTPGIETDQGIDKRDITGDDKHDDASGKDDQWSLKQIRVFDAWKKIRDRYGFAEGGEADGVLIAHLDTGYTKHPENWQDIKGKRPIDVAKGHDYYDDDNDPLDPLLSDRPLDNPGHGTASGSVIVSPAGCQLPGAKGCVNGIARGAQLVPLRVHRTVSQFNTRNLAHAIQDVAEGTVPGKPQLVSIAMGGPPTLTLWKAVKSAEKKGVLIVAAAGNYVRTVVWPARFRSTIAVAANNVRCAPWKQSSHGKAVDISAPGESVWRATFNEKHDYMNAMGKGTTFATGNTAGAAALWLSWHRNNPQLEELKKLGSITQAFRDALKISAWRPKANSNANPPGTFCDNYPWDRDYGSGILNVSALLDVPLGAPITRDLDGPELEDLPLFSSLYPPGTDSRQIKSNYLELFNSMRERDLFKMASFETEILYHYTMNEDVQRNMDDMAQGKRGIEPAENSRQALLRQDLSNTLRSYLMK